MNSERMQANVEFQFHSLEKNIYFLNINSSSFSIIIESKLKIHISVKISYSQ